MVSKNESFAATLKRLIEDKGLSKYAVAKLTGLSKQTLSQLELGRYEPSWQTVQLLCKALGVTCEAFADAGLQLPEQQHANPPGRPRKATVDVESPGERKKGRGKK